MDKSLTTRQLKVQNSFEDELGIFLEPQGIGLVISSGATLEVIYDTTTTPMTADLIQIKKDNDGTILINVYSESYILEIFEEGIQKY